MGKLPARPPRIFKRKLVTRRHVAICFVLRGGYWNSTTLVVLNQHLAIHSLIGTTRPRVSFFMNKFRKLGFVEYNGGLKVHSSLLSVVAG